VIPGPELTAVFQAIVRHIIVGSTFFLSKDRRKALDRRLRGREEYRQLRDADWLLLSWGKSGRTWLRVMLSRFYEIHFGLSRHEMLGFDNLHKLDSAIPRVFLPAAAMTPKWIFAAKRSFCWCGIHGMWRCPSIFSGISACDPTRKC
jgi:hypothetical protein